MPSDFPGRPQMVKGGLAVYESLKPGNKQPMIIVFQYNPEQIKRTLASRSPQPKPGNSGSAKEDVLKVMGAPLETINITVSLSAVDQLENTTGSDTVAQSGIYPELSVLEMLLYPPAASADRIESQAKAGKVQLDPKELSLPLVLLVWGKSRVVPVKLTSFSVTEEAFDANLNPIQAKVDLGLQVLTYIEYPEENLARATFIAYQKDKERLAGLYAPSDKGRTGINEVLLRRGLPSQL
jgi:hypothetical protein